MDVKKKRREGGGTDCNMEDGDTTMYLNIGRARRTWDVGSVVSCPAHVAEESLIRSDLTFPEAHVVSRRVRLTVIAICSCRCSLFLSVSLVISPLPLHTHAFASHTISIITQQPG